MRHLREETLTVSDVLAIARKFTDLTAIRTPGIWSLKVRPGGYGYIFWAQDGPETTTFETTSDDIKFIALSTEFLHAFAIAFTERVSAAAEVNPNASSASVLTAMELDLVRLMGEKVAV